jgi:hypothetical protein
MCLSVRRIRQGVSLVRVALAACFSKHLSNNQATTTSMAASISLKVRAETVRLSDETRARCVEECCKAERHICQYQKA